MTGSEDDATGQIDWAIVDRYLAGEATPAERAAFERWAAAHPNDHALIEAARAELDPARELADVPDPVAALARAERQLRSRGIVVGARLMRSRWVGAMRAAVAAVVIAAIAGLGAHYRWGESITGRSYVARAGQRLAVTLRDGTQLTLAPDSRLDVPMDYTTGHRSVRLTGEAYFAVVHDATHPFSVRAGDLVATDIGTQFDVRADADDRAVRVAVTEGSVDIRTARRAAGMSPLRAGDVATLTDRVLSITRGIDATRYTGWTRGELAFRDVPASEALRELGRWYDVDVTLADPAVREALLTASYSAADPLDGVLDAIGRSLGERVELRGRNVTVSKPAAGHIAGLVRDHGTK
jgi:transmembrane sensor